MNSQPRTPVEVSDGPAHPAEEYEEPVTAAELAAQWDAERPPPAGPVANLAAALAVIALGALGVVLSLRIGVGSPEAPSAGTWPLAVSVLLVALGVALAVTARRTHDTERFQRSSWGVLAGLLSMLAFVALVGRIGFEIPAALLAFFWLRFLGHESWRVSVVGSVLMVAAFYLVFVAALGVSIPHLL